MDSSRAACRSVACRTRVLRRGVRREGVSHELHHGHGDAALRGRALGSPNHIRLRQPVLSHQAHSHRHLRGGRALPDRNELGWRWQDSIIYLTHEVPNEPTFSAAAVVSKVSPLPLALLYSTHDEFVPFSDAQRMMELGGEPKRLWVVRASDHRFTDNLSGFDRSLLEAIDWVRQNGTQ